MNIPQEFYQMPPRDERARLIAEISRLREELRRFTDDDCYGRCENLLPWFVHETRGLLTAMDAHLTLDLVLNKLGFGEASTPAEAAASQRAVPALWLELDGTVRHGIPDELDPRDVVLYPEAVEMMRRWRAGGGRIVGFTAQGGVALGHLTLDYCGEAASRTQDLSGGLFDLIALCPHHPDADTPDMARCWCRPPRIGLIAEGALILSQRYSENYPPHQGLMVGATQAARDCAAAAGLDFQPASEWRAVARTDPIKESQ